VPLGPAALMSQDKANTVFLGSVSTLLVEAYTLGHTAALAPTDAIPIPRPPVAFVPYAG